MKRCKTQIFKFKMIGQSKISSFFSPSQKRKSSDEQVLSTFLFPVIDRDLLFRVETCKSFSHRPPL